ncbi:MAG TPA: hypothetical protein VKF83_11100 [Stellaceae bacterium]|nr:hypothetical protein [Stellaceae bacterium]
MPRALGCAKYTTAHAARDKTYTISGPVSLVEAVMELGRGGIDVQRYKGLAR